MFSTYKMSIRKLNILYGSQTGNAQEVSERIWRESKRFRFAGPVIALDDYSIEELIEEKYVIFICATTGQGDEPDNMKKFWKFLLRKNLPSDSLYNLKYAVLGMGDSSYVKYNFVAKRLNKRLSQLGATPILPLALADDQHDLGYDAVVDDWIPTLFKKLLQDFPMSQSIQDEINISYNKVEPRWNVEINTTKEDSKDNYPLYHCDTYKNPDNSFLAEILENKRITSVKHFQDVRLMKFSTNDQSYAPGDILYVRPQNSQEQINTFYTVLESNNAKIKPNMTIKLSVKDTYMPVPKYLEKEIKLDKLLREYFDLNAVPKRNVFRILAEITSSELENEKLIEFTTPEGQEDMYNYCNRPKRTIVEVLQDFPHACENLNVDIMFEMFSPIKPRAFSIASGFHAHKNEIHLLVAVVEYKTKLIKARKGLCSNWLANLQNGCKVPVWIKKGSLKFPKDKNVPIIMVGPGTGVAPFRSFLCEEEIRSERNAKTLMLFFGCRYKNYDFLCQDDFKRLEKTSKLTLHCAFSRDEEYKIYVQHKIKENGVEVWERIKDLTACIFVAGNSKDMPQSVKEAFVAVCKQHGQMSKEEATLYIETIEKDGRYQTETWT